MPPRKRPPGPGTPAPARPADTSVHLPGFIHYLQAECGLSQNTVLAYGTDLRQFSEWFVEFGPSVLQQTTISTLTTWLESLREKQLAATSMARKLVAVKMFFRYLMLEGVIQDSVADLVNSPRLWQHLPKVLSPDMVNKLLDAPGRDDRWFRRDRALLCLLYATGCRASEICGLSIEDVHLDEGFCRCLGKGNKERMVSLNPVAVDAIRSYLEHERPKLAAAANDGALLLSSRGRAVHRIMVWKLVKRYAGRIGASKDVTPHTLRHSFATHMLAGGAEIRALQELLGHASIRTTQIYTQVEHSRLKTIHENCHPRG